MRWIFLMIYLISFQNIMGNNHLLSNFTLIRERKERYCDKLKINTAFILTTDRDTHRANSKNLLDGFGEAAINFFLVDSSTSNLIEIIGPLIISILFILAFIATIIIFIIYMFPGYFVTRKEFITLLKQRFFFYTTLILIILLAVLFIYFSQSLSQSIEEAKYSVCVYYWVQYDFMAGVGESNYTFIGFDNIRTTTSILESELTNFNSLYQNFQNIRSKNIESIKDVPLRAAFNYTKRYQERTILAYDETDITEEIPVPIESLTTYINNDIETEFKEIAYVSNNVLEMIDSGIGIIDRYEESNDVLIMSMINAMNYINNSFKDLLNALLSYEEPLEKLISYMRVVNIILVILAIIVFCFLPIFILFYILRNRSDKYVWMVKTVKTVQVILGILSFLFALILLLFLIANLLVSGYCYYSDKLLDRSSLSSSFVDTYKDSLNLTDSSIKFVVSNCYNQTTANFATFFTTDTGTDSSENNDEDVVVDPKIPENDDESQDNDDENNENENNDDTNTDNNNDTEDNNDNDTLIGDGITNRLLSEAGLFGASADNSSDLVEVPDNFDIKLLSQFQAFVKSFFIYDQFYSASLRTASPTVQAFEQYLKNFRDGIFPNFNTYIIARNELNDILLTSAYQVELNIRSCSSDTDKECLTMKDTTVGEFSAKIAQDENVDDKSRAINIFTRLKESLESGENLYAQMIFNLIQKNNSEGHPTPGSSAEEARSLLINIWSDMAAVRDTLKNSFAIFESYGGDLSSLTNCYVIKRETKLMEAPVCFMLMPKLFAALSFLLLINLVLLLILWGICCSIKYSGNLTVGSWVSKTTVASAWDKSKGNVLSFYENSEIMVNDESKVTEEEEEDDYFEDSEDEG